MQSGRLTASHSRRSPATRNDDDDELFGTYSLSRPSKRSSHSRLSTDSGAGSLEDFGSRRYSSPDFWREGPGRRHTAPTRKPASPNIYADRIVRRPNTVHAWEGCSPRCSLSRYAPLPAIGSQKQRMRAYDFERPVPVRRQCFMGPLDIDNVEEVIVDDVNDNSQLDSDMDLQRSLFALSLDTDIDSDFDEESESLQQCPSDNEESDSSKPKRSIIRSATFTIEKDRPDVRGPLLTVAIRLPDGARVAGRFDCKDTLKSVCEFALQKKEGLGPKECSLVTMEVPKRIFRDLNMSLKEAEIDDKTLLYLQTKGDSDSE